MRKLQRSRNRSREAAEALCKVPDSSVLLSRLPEEGLEAAQEDLRLSCTDLCAECEFETGCAKGAEEGGA
jgi:hypothetical protein